MYIHIILKATNGEPPKRAPRSIETAASARWPFSNRRSWVQRMVAVPIWVCTLPAPSFPHRRRMPGKSSDSAERPQIQRLSDAVIRGLHLQVPLLVLPWAIGRCTNEMWTPRAVHPKIEHPESFNRLVITAFMEPSRGTSYIAVCRLAAPNSHLKDM